MPLPAPVMIATLPSMARESTASEPPSSMGSSSLPCRQENADTVRFTGSGTAPACCLGEQLQHRQRFLPGEAAVGDALAMDELRATPDGLAASHQETFDHDAHHALAPCPQLVGEVLRY